jgi:uncharacterized protein YbcI
MDVTRAQGTSVLTDVSNAMVKLHKEQFGRGPTCVRAYFAGPDALLCSLDDALLPAERKMVELGQQERVRESRPLCATRRLSTPATASARSA